MILGPLIPSGKQDNNGIPVFCKIDPISGAVINPQLRYALPDRFYVPWISKRQATDTHVNANLRTPVAQTGKPFKDLPTFLWVAKKHKCES